MARVLDATPIRATRCARTPAFLYALGCKLGTAFIAAHFKHIAPRRHSRSHLAPATLISLRTREICFQTGLPLGIVRLGDDPSGIEVIRLSMCAMHKHIDAVRVFYARFPRFRARASLYKLHESSARIITHAWVC